MVGYVDLRSHNAALPTFPRRGPRVINFNAPISRQGLASFEAKAKAQTVVGSLKPALSGIDAFATAPPGPLTDNFSGVDLPTAGSTLIDSTARTSVTPVSPTRVAASNSPGRRHVPVATIVGAVVGVAAAVTIASVSILYFRRCQHRRRAALRRDAHQRDSTSRHVDVPPTKRGSMMDDEEAASVEIAASDPVEPPGRPSISMRYYVRFWDSAWCPRRCSLTKYDRRILTTRARTHPLFPPSAVTVNVPYPFNLPVYQKSMGLRDWSTIALVSLWTRRARVGLHSETLSLALPFRVLDGHVMTTDRPHGTSHYQCLH